MFYEFHTQIQPQLPVIFEKSRVKRQSQAYQHLHQNPELILVRQGRLQLRLDDHCIVLEPGQMGVVAGNVLHHLATEDEFCEYDFLIIEQAQCAEVTLLPEFTDCPEILQIYRQIAQEITQKKANYSLAVIGLCKLLMAMLSRQVEQQSSARREVSAKVALVRRATEYIFANLGEAVTLDGISNALNVNKYYLSHVFKEVTGKTIIQMLQFARCRNAKNLLAGGGCNVSQAAFSSGFDNLSYFSKVYKAYMGCSPVEEYKKHK